MVEPMMKYLQFNNQKKIKIILIEWKAQKIRFSTLKNIKLWKHTK